VKIVSSSSVLNCAAVVEFAFGVTERGMTGSEFGLGNIHYDM
jgi:hypothetical protein